MKIEMNVNKCNKYVCVFFYSVVVVVEVEGKA